MIKESGTNMVIISFTTLDNKRWDNPKGLFIKLDDGSILRFENSLIRVKQDESMLWSYLSALTLDKSSAKQFTKYKIVNFVVDNGDNPVTPEWGEKSGIGLRAFIILNEI